MKTAKLVIGIISIVLFIVIAFQSCAVGIVNIMESNPGDSSGSAGIVLALLMLVAGIVGISTRNSKGGGMTAGWFYIVGGLIGITSAGVFKDLIIWGIVSFAFAIVFFIGSSKIGVENSGKPQKALYKRWSFWVLIVLGIFFLLWIVGYTSMNGEEAELKNDLPETSEQPAEIETATEYISFGDTFEFDGLEITFNDDIEWHTISNQFSDLDGKDAFTIGMKVRNVSGETHKLNMFYYTQFGPKGIKLDSVSAHIDDISYAGDMRDGAELETAMAFLYEGDGDYFVEFAKLASKNKTEVMVPITKSLPDSEQ